MASATESMLDYSSTLDVYRPMPPVAISREMILSSGSRKRKKKETVDAYLRRVTHLTLQDRSIEHMQHINLCENLSVLYLHENNISRIGSLNGLKYLTHLFLQNNDIQKIEALDHLTSLEKLYLGGNRIQVVEGLAHLSRLEELHVENQRMPAGEALLFDPRSMMGLQKCLRTLNASGNNISSLAGVSNLCKLSSLNLNNNNIDSFKSLEAVLRSCYSLCELEVMGNPIMKMRKCRERIIVMAPILTSLNNRDINILERQFLVNWKSSRKSKQLKGASNKMNEDVLNVPARQATTTRLPPIQNRGFCGSKKTNHQRRDYQDFRAVSNKKHIISTVGEVQCTTVHHKPSRTRPGMT